MRVTTGKVVDGRIEVTGESLAEGLTVTVLAPEGGETFALGEAEEKELLAAMTEADRGDLLSTDEVFAAVAQKE